MVINVESNTTCLTVRLGHVSPVLFRAIPLEVAYPKASEAACNFDAPFHSASIHPILTLGSLRIVDTIQYLLYNIY